MRHKRPASPIQKPNNVVTVDFLDEDDDYDMGWDDIGHIGDQAQIIGGNGNDELSNLIAIERVDSRDVVFDNRPKKTKILGKYVMGDVLGEWKNFDQITRKWYFLSKI